MERSLQVILSRGITVAYHRVAVNSDMLNVKKQICSAEKFQCREYAGGPPGEGHGDLHQIYMPEHSESLNVQLLWAQEAPTFCPGQGP